MVLLAFVTTWPEPVTIVDPSLSPPVGGDTGGGAVGAGALLTVTLTDFVTCLDDVAQARVYVTEALRAGVRQVPLVPAEFNGPGVIEQLVAFDELHDKSLVCPVVTLVGEAVNSLMIGSAGGGALTNVSSVSDFAAVVPWEFLQVTVKVVLTLMAGVVQLLLVAALFGPPGVTLQLTVFELVHVSLTVLPSSTGDVLELVNVSTAGESVAGLTVTLTVLEAAFVPAAPLHLRVNVVVAVRAVVCQLVDVVLFGPPGVMSHPVLLVTVQLSALDSPAVMVEGVAINEPITGSTAGA